MNMLDLPLGELARKIPGATAVFHNHQLDFCCGGKHSLRDAAASKEADATAIAAELEQLVGLQTRERDFSEASDAELIEHILTRYHDIHRQQLPELIRLASRVELVHAGHTECPAGLTRHLEQMQQELEEHMRKEEQILFPMIARGMTRVAIQPVGVMRRDHDDHGDALAEMVRLARGIELPPGACNTWRALYLGLETLKQDLMDHIHLENNILFDRIDGPASRPSTQAPEDIHHG